MLLLSDPFRARVNKHCAAADCRFCCWLERKRYSRAREREAQQRVSSCIRAHGWLARTQTDTKGRWSAREKVARRARGEPWAPNNGAVAVLAQPEQGGDGMECARRLEGEGFFSFLTGRRFTTQQRQWKAQSRGLGLHVSQWNCKREQKGRGQVVQKRDGCERA